MHKRILLQIVKYVDRAFIYWKTEQLNKTVKFINLQILKTSLYVYEHTKKYQSTAGVLKKNANHMSISKG